MLLVDSLTTKRWLFKKATRTTEQAEASTIIKADQIYSENATTLSLVAG